jgi:hypothetical protein
MKKIDLKIKKLEKEERHYARLLEKEREEYKVPYELQKKKNTGGVYLMSHRFNQSRLPVPEPLRVQIDSALSDMKIEMKELYASEEVIDKYITLKEEMLTLFTLDNYIERKRAELGKPVLDTMTLEQFNVPKEEVELEVIEELAEGAEEIVEFKEEESKKSKDKKEKVKVEKK